MIEKFFMARIKRTSGTWEKGVEVHNTLDSARQSYHAYLGAYGYGHDANTDYVQCAILDINGAVRDSMVYNRIEEEPAEEA